MGKVQQQPSLFGRQPGLATELWQRQHRHSPAAANFLGFGGRLAGRLQQKQHMPRLQCVVQTISSSAI